MIKGQLLDLKKKLGHLMVFIKENDKTGVPYFYRYLEVMQKNISISEKANFDGMDELMGLLNEDWITANNAHTGIPEYGIWLEDYESIVKMNKIWKAMVWEIDRLLQTLEGK